MPKTPKTSTEIVRQVAEIDYPALIKQMVETRVAEVMADKQNEAFGPFFEVKEISIELRRRQTLAERRKWVVYFEYWGCMACGQKDRPHRCLGMCEKCYTNIQSRLFEIRRELMRDTESPEIGFKDGVEFARQALMPSIEKLARKRKRNTKFSDTVAAVRRELPQDA